MARTKQTARKVPIVDLPPFKELVQEAPEEQNQPEPPVQVQGKTTKEEVELPDQILKRNKKGPEMHISSYSQPLFYESCERNFR